MLFGLLARRRLSFSCTARERELNSVHAANRADETQWNVHFRVSQVLSRSSSKQTASCWARGTLMNVEGKVTAPVCIAAGVLRPLPGMHLVTATPSIVMHATEPMASASSKSPAICTWLMNTRYSIHSASSTSRVEKISFLPSHTWLCVMKRAISEGS